ncbi:glycosyltransferase family 2 protein [Croceicoccus sp. F390]|uniref:Glycosyltransferase family 2 protein n=1 Tax=Croceicoccus esteveae TaxID=3075597 RepID=A0ABU2ZFT9_9SPHN|nr:glycosyltransferase family 2 protein [Croceicoccus sp. F390]MDT0575465.1 glycosyltransferase family 2 protein [Croceicoccus sp. F390]
MVSVIVPAFNAAATLEETLLSVRDQTHRNLEIIVIDDGSHDRTREIGERQASLDPRIRVISQPNGGVAVARNHGIEQARGAFVAPVDADDLWRPRKIERQLRALRAAGPETGLIYCWSAAIDENGDVISRSSTPSHAGDVLPQLFYGNFVGNGSSALMRKEAILAAGGYDPTLRARKAQGCEDWKLYLLLAERTHFAVVPDYLVGYRQTSAAMSGDVSQMLRSDAIVRDEMAARHPEYLFELDWGRRHYLEWLLWREMTALNWHNCMTLIHERRPESNPLRMVARRAKLGAKFLRQKLRGQPGSSAGSAYLAKGAKPEPGVSLPDGSPPADMMS